MLDILGRSAGPRAASLLLEQRWSGTTDGSPGTLRARKETLAPKTRQNVLVVGPPEVQKLRLGMLALVALGTLAMLTDLLLIGHLEDPNQLIPLGVGGVGLVVALWAGVFPGVGALRVLQFVMLIYVGTGIVGMTLHAQANAEFQREVDAAISGLDLMWKVLGAKAPPSLSPGLLVQLGLLGLLFTYKHPALKEGDGAGGFG